MKWNRKGASAAIAVSALLASGLAFAQQQMEGVRGADAVQGIFGVDAETLARAIQTAANSDSILSVVAGVVNMAALLAAVLLVLMTFISAILQTGEHGKVGGRYSMVWVPVRVALAAGMLTPLSLGGYSVIQAMVLWVGMQGSGFADQAWTRSNGYLSENMALGSVVLPRFNANVASKIYQMEACAEAVERSAAGDGSAGATAAFGVSRPDSFVQTLTREGGWVRDESLIITRQMSYDGSGELAGVSEACGAITLERTVPVGADALTVVEQGIADVSLDNQEHSIRVIQVAVRQLVAARMNGEIGAEQVRSELIRLEGVYVTNMRRASQTINRLKHAAELELRERQMDTAAANGWLVAGAYYMTFAAYDARMNAQFGADPLFSGARTGELPPALLQDVAPHLAAAQQIIPRTEDPAETYVHPDYEGDGETFLKAVAGTLAGVADPRKAMEQAVDVMQRKMADWAREGYAWIAEVPLDNGQGLIPKLVQWGHMLLALAAGAFVVLSGVSIVASLGTGLGGLVVLAVGLPYVLALGGVGAMMAYLLPAIPLLIWIAGVAAWLMMLVQAVVAAPLWAAAHASPEGEGFAGQRAMTGYMLMVSLLARPVLMIAGLLAGMLIFDFMAGFVLKAVQIFSGASAGPGIAAPGLLGMMFWIFITAGMLAVLARWSFSLIEFVPNTVLQFIGAGTGSIGETNMAEQARTMAIAAWASTQRGTANAMSKFNRKPSPNDGGVSASAGRGR